MSFYLNDDPEGDQPDFLQICPNCSGRSFYEDPVTGTLTCSSCYTQSQTATQEELDPLEDNVGIVSSSRRRRSGSAARSGEQNPGRSKRNLHEFDNSKELADVESCCMAFQWLLWDASKCVSKLAGISERCAKSESVDFRDDNSRHSIMENTVKNIWFTYLGSWMEATEKYATMYPEMRVSFRDYFVGKHNLVNLRTHLSLTVGKRIQDEMIDDIMKDWEKSQSVENEDDTEKSALSYTENSQSSTMNSNIHGTNLSDTDACSSTKDVKVSDARKKRPAIISVQHLSKKLRQKTLFRHPNGIYDLKRLDAVLKIQPSLTLLLSILQLALTHLQTGVAPYHLTMWVFNGLIPHALNGYELLPRVLKEKVVTVKKFFERSFIPPADTVSDLTFLLASACGWYKKQELQCVGSQHDWRQSKKNESSLSTHDLNVVGVEDWSLKLMYHKSVYNVPLLAARMVKDLGFTQQVLDNAFALMGVNKESTNTDIKLNDNDNYTGQNVSATLESASPDKLYTPIHVAAVIVVACKLCPDWETWQINNLHANTRRAAFIPWNESHLQLLGNGPTLQYYVDFLEKTAFNGLKNRESLALFFESFEKNMCSGEELKPCNNTHRRGNPSIARVLPNTILAGAPNPNLTDPCPFDNVSSNSISLDQSQTRQQQCANSNNFGSYSSHKLCKKNHGSLETYHTSYELIVEYICYMIEGKSPEKLHNLVQILEVEMQSHAHE